LPKATPEPQMPAAQALRGSRKKIQQDTSLFAGTVGGDGDK